MTPDSELLYSYASQGDEAAFAEVVSRHTNLVYSAALRMVAGDVHLAQDVAQKVFSIMAGRASTLVSCVSITGWLYITTHHVASVTVRAERRRRQREQAAFAMHAETTRNEIDWSRLQPVLDEEVCRLNQVDREAVLLRFFHNKSHREVGEALGVSEDLARKRVERALEKLRASFSRRGLAVSSVVLAETISANSVQAAPAGLSAALARASLAKPAPVGLGWQIFLFTMKTKITLVAIVLILSLSLIGAWHWSQSNNPGGSTPATSLPNLGIPKLAAKSVASQVAAPVLPAVSASSSGAVLPVDERTAVPDVEPDLTNTVTDIISTLENKDIDGFVQKYVAPTIVDLVKAKTAVRLDADPNMTPETKAQAVASLDQQVPLLIQQETQNLMSDPHTAQRFQILAAALRTAQATPPQMNDTGDQATYPLQTNGQLNLPTSLVLTRKNGQWTINMVSTMMNYLPAP